MQSSLPYITRHQQHKLEAVIASIVREVKPAKIICYGVRTSAHHTWSCFLQHAESPATVDYDLLVISHESEKAKRNALAQAFCARNGEDIKFNTVVHSIQAVNDALKEGDFFFTRLYHIGVMLYDSNAQVLTVPSAKAEAALSASVVQAHWQKWFGQAQVFHESVDYFLSNQCHALAVFMLHQAVEHSCLALIRIYMGYRANTHKLARLLALTENFSLYPLTIFPRLTPEQSNLFAVLEAAYVEARYNPAYAVEASTVRTLQKQVKELLQVAELLYDDKLKALEHKAPEQTIQRHLLPFESICLDTFAHVVLQKGDVESVMITSTTGSAAAIDTLVEDKRLWVRMNTREFDHVPQATVYITYVTLTGLVVHQSGNVTCSEPVEGVRLGIVQNGRGEINLNVNVMALDVTLAKTGNVTAAGCVGEAHIQHHRSGTFDGSALEADTAEVTILGSGSVSIHVEEALTAVLRGTGDLLYSGTPRIRSLKITGSGKLKPRSL